MAYVPKVYRTSGGDQLVVSSGGVLELQDGATLSLDGQDITSTGGLAASSGTFTADIALTSGISASTGIFTGGVQLSSTLTAVHGTFSSGITATTGNFSGDIAITSGITATTGNFSGGIALTSGITATTGGFSSGASFGGAVSFTSGISATTGNFSGGVAVSSAASVANTLTMSSAASVANTFTMSSAMVRPFETFATGVSSGQAIKTYGVSQIWSSGTETGRLWSLAAGVAGYEKWVYNVGAVSTAAAIVQTSGSAAMINGTNTSLIFSTGGTNRQWAFLLCENSTNWMLLAASTDVTLSAS